MSVDRNYPLQISLMGDEAMPQSEKQNVSDAFPDGITNEDPRILNVSAEPPQETSELNSITQTAAMWIRAILGTEIDRIISQAAKSGTAASQIAESLQGKTGVKSQAEMPNGPSAPPLYRRAGDNNTQSQWRVDSSARFSKAATGDHFRPINQSGEAPVPRQTQTAGATKQNFVEMLPAIRQTIETLLEQQRNSVTRHELSRELQRLHLVLESRK